MLPLSPHSLAIGTNSPETHISQQPNMYDPCGLHSRGTTLHPAIHSPILLLKDSIVVDISSNNSCSRCSGMSSIRAKSSETQYCQCMGQRSLNHRIPHSIVIWHSPKPLETLFGASSLSLHSRSIGHLCCCLLRLKSPLVLPVSCVKPHLLAPFKAGQ